MRSQRAFTLVELLVVIVIMGILAALLTPAIAAAIRIARIHSCGHNLQELWRMETVYQSQYGGRSALFPQETGKSFWLKLSQTTPRPLVDPGSDLFFCPLSPQPRTRGSCHYRGPAQDVNSYTDSGWAVGADDKQNHGQGEGGNVLRKSGDVANYPEGDPVWLDAERLMD